MSDLDADLYGDLYETDFTEQTGQDEQPSAIETLTTDDTSTSAEEPPVPAKTIPMTTTTAMTIKPATTPIPSYQGSMAPTISPVTQQIPTYEEPQNMDYREQGLQRTGAERTVRPSEMKDEGKMFIGGLNWDTTDEGLREYFSQFGKVDACTIMRDAAGRSRCFAFLTFEDPASVNAVMVQEHVLDGKVIDPKRAIPRQEHQRATKLFIGGLAATVTSESMREFFSQFGKVIDSTVMLDRETGRSKGFGFVSFEDTNVQPFLGFGNLEIDGKLIDVKLAQPRFQRDQFSEDQNGYQGASTGAAAGAGMGRGGGGNFNNNFNNAAGGAGAAGGQGNAPFDPQALANLYTRMFQMASGGMNPMMGMGGMGGGMGSMGGMGGMGNMNAMMNMMGGGGGAGGMSGAMAGRGGMMGGGGMGRGGIPRGPRGAGGGAPQGGAPTGAVGVGPQRAGQRGQHNYHPYARGA